MYEVTKIEKSTPEKLAVRVKFNGGVEQYYEVDLAGATDLDKHVDEVLTKASESVAAPKTESCSVVAAKVKFAQPVKAAALEAVEAEIVK